MTTRSANKLLTPANCDTGNLKMPSAPTIAVSPAKHRILVVEDQSINQIVIKNFLDRRGYEVDIAATGQAALTLYALNAYAIILMDIGLPDIQGTEVTKQIRALELLHEKHTPIIALTSNGLSAKPACLAVGMDDFSVKPFDTKTLDALIKTWLQH